MFPSYREGFPNVVLQAGAMNLPAIVSNINGCNEIITHLENGLIVSVKEVKPLYESMILLIKNPSLCNSLSLNSRERIKLKYERAHFWNLLLKEYKLLESNVDKVSTIVNNFRQISVDFTSESSMNTNLFSCINQTKQTPSEHCLTACADSSPSMGAFSSGILLWCK